MMKANDNIAKDIDKDKILSNVEKVCCVLLDALLIDYKNDHNTKETPKRMAKMFVNEVFHGRYTERPRVTHFPNVKKVDEIYTVGPITVRSACAHHFCPIFGSVWIGVRPSENIIGLSKFHRITEWVMARPQIQEEAVVMLADELESLIKPLGLAVIMKATHTCITWRGVKDNESTMISSVMRGEFLTSIHQKEEFLRLIRGQGFDN